MFKNPSDARQIHVIRRQMYPGNSKFLTNVYKHVTRYAHGYIFLDLRQETPEPYRVRSNILRDEFPMVLYKQAGDETEIFVMDNVKRYSSFLKRIVTAPEAIRRRLLESSNLNIIKAICELLLNIVQKNIAVKGIVISQLKKHKNLLYKLFETKVFEARKSILVAHPKILALLKAVLK